MAIYKQNEGYINHTTSENERELHNKTKQIKLSQNHTTSENERKLHNKTKQINLH